MLLVRKCHEQPALLSPSDLNPIRALVGDGALDYALVVGSFHYINRIADLLDVPPEILPLPLRRFEPLRRGTVRLFSHFIGKMDLANRPYDFSFEEALERLSPLFARATGLVLQNQLDGLRARPKIVEVLHLLLEEREERSSLDRSTLSLIQETVETALPASIGQAEGLYHHLGDPVEDFAFIGTRYAYRTSKEMIRALKGAGYDDLGLLDLAIAVADANQWARLYRLLGLEAKIYYL